MRSKARDPACAGKDELISNFRNMDNRNPAKFRFFERDRRLSVCSPAVNRKKSPKYAPVTNRLI